MFNKKIILVAFFLIVFHVGYSQCAMCKAVVESGNNTMAEGVNNGITYLMVFPYLLVGLLIYVLYKYKKKIQN